MNTIQARFDRHWAQHEYRFQRFARIRMRDPEEADDLLQEGRIRAFQAFSQYDPERKFESWVFTILRNLAHDRLRTRARYPMQVSLVVYEESSYTAGADVYSTVDTQITINRAVSRLSGRDQTMVGMVMEHGTDYDAIAKSLNIPIGTVRSRLHRTREKLRAQVL